MAFSAVSHHKSLEQGCRDPREGWGSLPCHDFTHPMELWSSGTTRSRVRPYCPLQDQRGWVLGPTLFYHIGLSCFTNTFFDNFPPITHLFFFWMKRKGSSSGRMIEVLFNFTFYMEDTGVKAGSRRLIPIHQFVCKHVITKSDADQQFKFCPSCSEISSAEHL